jgi:hypothetical protein
VTGFGLNRTVNTCVPFAFELPKIENRKVKTAHLQVIVAEVDANGDGYADDLPDTDSVAARDSSGANLELFKN